MIRERGRLCGKKIRGSGSGSWWLSVPSAAFVSVPLVPLQFRACSLGLWRLRVLMVSGKVGARYPKPSPQNELISYQPCTRVGSVCSMKNFRNPSWNWLEHLDEERFLLTLSPQSLPACPPMPELMLGGRITQAEGQRTHVHRAVRRRPLTLFPNK